MTAGLMEWSGTALMSYEGASNGGRRWEPDRTEWLEIREAWGGS
jgi:hypothetical protein